MVRCDAAPRPGAGLPGAPVVGVRPRLARRAGCLRGRGEEARGVGEQHRPRAGGGDADRRRPEGGLQAPLRRARLAGGHAGGPRAPLRPERPPRLPRDLPVPARHLPRRVGDHTHTAAERAVAVQGPLQAAEAARPALPRALGGRQGPLGRPEQRAPGVDGGGAGEHGNRGLPGAPRAGGGARARQGRQLRRRGEERRLQRSGRAVGGRGGGVLRGDPRIGR
mmetsp:Transcript_75027/g.212032  ORF Transcript_75027/g.212032 Transcript_75027/m.212032 type:complete len:222 (-) Transcript_75027:2513-3178(-)